MDLGEIFTTLGTEYIRSRYAPKPSVPMAAPQLPAGAGQNLLPIIPPVIAGGAAGALPELVEGVSGIFSKPRRRRRRRRLATCSDLSDLAALKAILGNGENFKMWIATRGRCG